MIDNKNKGGRPWLTEEQKAQRKDCLLQKLEPYLKSGLSVNKALREARIHNSEFYKYMREDRLFGEKVRHFRDFISILVNNILFRELMSIVEKQIGNESKGIKPQTLSREDRDFLWWFALNSNLTGEEYGRRIKDNFFDPEVEIQRVRSLLEETSTKEMLHY